MRLRLLNIAFALSHETHFLCVPYISSNVLLGDQNRRKAKTKYVQFLATGKY